jgi:hypothetical protein
LVPKTLILESQSQQVAAPSDAPGYGHGLRSRNAVWVNFVFATVVVVGVFVQVYLITSYFTGAGEGALDAHGFVGGVVIHASEAIVFLSALVAFWRNWTWIGFNFWLLLLGTAQIFLSPPDEDPASGWVTACTACSRCSCS